MSLNLVDVFTVATVEEGTPHAEVSPYTAFGVEAVVRSVTLTLKEHWDKDLTVNDRLEIRKVAKQSKEEGFPIDFSLHDGTTTVINFIVQAPEPGAKK